MNKLFEINIDNQNKNKLVIKYTNTNYQFELNLYFKHIYQINNSTIIQTNDDQIYYIDKAIYRLNINTIPFKFYQKYTTYGNVINIVENNYYIYLLEHNTFTSKSEHIINELTKDKINIETIYPIYECIDCYKGSNCQCMTYSGQFTKTIIFNPI